MGRERPQNYFSSPPFSFFFPLTSSCSLFSFPLTFSLNLFYGAAQVPPSIHLLHRPSNRPYIIRPRYPVMSPPETKNIIPCFNLNKAVQTNIASIWLHQLPTISLLRLPTTTRATYLIVVHDSTTPRLLSKSPTLIQLPLVCVVPLQ